MGFADTFISRRGVKYPAAAYIPNLCFYSDAKDPFRALFSKCPQTTKFNTDSLMAIRDLLHAAVKADDEEFFKVIKIVDQKLSEYIQSVKKENFIDYYLTFRIKAYIHLITDSYEHIMFSNFGYVIEVLLMILFHSAPQIMALILLIPSIIISIISRNKLLMASALLTTSSIILTLAYISVGLSNQPRYLLSGLPYICWGIGVMTHFLYAYTKAKIKL